MWMLTANYQPKTAELNGGVREQIEGAEGISKPLRKNNKSNQLNTIKLPGTNPPIKKYTRKDPWLQLHM